MAMASTAKYDPDKPPPVGTPEHALWLVHWHFEWENPDQVERLADLYHDEVVWEVPARRIILRSKREVVDNYKRIFDSALDLKQEPIERYATPTRVFDDLEATFKLTSSVGFPNHPLPIGTRVAMRLAHNFHIRDGLISRENSYEIWRPDISR
jgi:ketosteroid isomerase-like protein